MTPPAASRRADARRPQLAIRDEVKPFVLLAAVVAGIGLNRVAGGSLARFHWIVPVGLFLVVFSVMAFVEVGGVGRAFRRQLKPTALAVSTNYVVVPLFAWTLGWLLLHDHPDLWAGVILYTLTPCIGWYLIFIDLAKGNMEWGLAMLPVDIVLQILLLPVYLWLLVDNVVPVDVATLARSVAVFLVLPSVAAFVTRRLLTARVGRAFTDGPYRKVVVELKLWALLAVVVGIFATQPRLAGSDLTGVGLIVAVITLFFLGVFVIALAIGRVFKLGYADTTTMVFEITARNSESVVGVAAVAFAGRPLVILAILIGPVVELPVLLALSRVLLRLRERWAWPDLAPRRRAPTSAP